jgi:signal transduction histidine kinase
VGFDIANPSPATGDIAHGGYGLTAMRERMMLVGGQLVVESAPGDGTTVAARVPLSSVDAARLAGSDGQKSR